MVVSAYWFTRAFISNFEKEANFSTDTIKAQLHTVTWSPAQNTDRYRSNLDNEVAAGDGYTAGGVTLGTKSLANTANVVAFDHADPEWTATGDGFTARYMVTYDDTPATDAEKPLYWWMDFGADETASGGGTFTVQMHADGAATITPASAA